MNDLRGEENDRSVSPATASWPESAGLRRLLYVVDDEPSRDPAFHRALRLAELSGAELTVAVPIEESPPPASDLLGLEPEAIHEVVSDYHRARLEPILTFYREKGHQIEVRVLRGRPELEIAREVVEHAHDLVIKHAGPGTERRRRPSGLDQKLIRGCPSPVWIEHAEDTSDVRRILIPLDVDPREDDRRVLAHDVLAVGLALAEMLDAEVDVLHAWWAYGEVELRAGFARTSRDRVEEYVRQLRDLHGRWLEDVVGSMDTTASVSSHLVKGTAERVIPAFANETRPELIVMGTAARAGVRDLVLGNTAEGVLGRVQAGVLFVKPPDFTTPLPLDD